MNATPTPENMSEINTPRTDAVIVKWQEDLSLDETYHGMMTRHARQLERELNQAQQTIAQKDGELQRLREALNGTLEFINELGHYDKPAYKQGEKALSTPSPSAVVPWEVVEKYLSFTIPDIHNTKRALEYEQALEQLQSYAPKGK